MHRTIVGLAAVTALALPAQALAQDPPAPVKPPKFFFTCQGEAPDPRANKLQNLELVGWDTVAPAASFQSGAGCGTADLILTSDDPYNAADGVFGGTFGGAFTQVNIELHSLLTSAPWSRGLEGNLIFVRLTVGGVEVANREFDLIGTPSSTQATEKFTLTIDKLNVPRGLDSREILITVDSFTNGWVWGASEIPASAEFIPPVEETTTAARKAANRRAAARRAALKRRAAAKRRAARP